MSLHEHMQRLDPNRTWVRLTTVLAVAGAMVVADRRLSAIERGIDDLRKDVREQWTAADMQLWAAQLKIDNATLTVPSAALIRRDRQTQLTN